MKKLILLVVMMLITAVGYTATGDITKAEIRPDVASYQLDTNKCSQNKTRFVNITYRRWLCSLSE